MRARSIGCRFAHFIDLGQLCCKNYVVRTKSPRKSRLDEQPDGGQGMNEVLMAEGEIPETSSALRNIVIVVGIIAVISLALNIYLFVQVSNLEKAQQVNAADTKTLAKRLATDETSLKASTEELASKLGMPEQEFQSRLADRTKDLEAKQRLAEARLAKEQKAAIGQVNEQVAGVKSDLGGAKTDIATTKTDLEATKMKLEKTIGDLNIQSGLVAHNSEELEFLKHKGDKNYAEFTIIKGQKPTPVSTVSLELRKVDVKKGKFTLNVLADDKTIEKKDRNMMEPLQFYTGRDRQLYELVVFTMEKNKVSGYIATPKGMGAAAK